MENKTELIERLRKIANELENDLNPKFEVGKWYYTKVGSLYYIESINGNKCYGYGLRYDNEWKNGEVCLVENIKRIATESEALEALTKEAVKRFPIGSKIAPNFYNNLSLRHTIKSHIFYINNNTLRIRNSSCNGCDLNIFHNGIWATVIKERSFEDWWNDYLSSPKAVKDYMKETKTDLIEILKNLPND